MYTCTLARLRDLQSQIQAMADVLHLPSGLQMPDSPAMRWKFLSYDVRRPSVEIAERFEGSAVEAVAHAKNLSTGDGSMLLVVSEGEVMPLAPVDDWRRRLIQERADGLGWNLVDDDFDHGGWHTSARNAADYVLQRFNVGYVLAICVQNVAGDWVQAVLHDGRDTAGEAGHGLRGPHDIHQA